MDRREIERRLRTVGDPAPPPALMARLKQGVPDSLQRPEPSVGPWRWTAMVRVGAVTAAAVAAVAAMTWMATALFGPGVALAAMLEPVARATEQARAVHVVLRVLTREGEDFSFVNTSGSPERVEAWVQWTGQAGDAFKMRIDKRDRLYSFDGAESIFYHPLSGEAYRGAGAAMDADLFWPAAWVRQIRSLPPEEVEVLEHREERGAGYLLLREKGKETGPRRPAFLGEFERETEVTWDLETHLLTGLKRWIYDGGRRRLFLELATIEYPPGIEVARFHLEIPDDVRWGGAAEAPAALASLGPREVAERLFEAAMAGDRKTLEMLVPSPHMVDWLMDEAHRPSEIQFIGEPFRTGDYPGVYVPYRVRLGRWTKTHDLALRNDNEQGRWLYDGGI
jgi:hypothetical protein